MRAAVLAPLLTLLLATSCVGAEPVAPAPSVGVTLAPAVSPPARGVFRYALAGDPPVLDPWNVSDEVALQVTRQLFDGLVGFAPAGFEVVPRLATSWRVSADGLQWTFTLREGVRFHDGTPLDAAAVVANFERGRSRTSPLRPSRPAGDDFDRWAQVWGGFDAEALITRVEAPAGGPVTFTTRVPYGPFLAALALPSFAIVSPRSIAQDRDGFMLSATKGLAGTGPVLLAPGGWEAGRIPLDRDAGHWDRGRPGVDQLVFKVVADPLARVAELRAGGVDAIGDVPLRDLTTVRSDPNLQTIARSGGLLASVGISALVKPLDDARVRRALAMALNRAALIGPVYSGETRVASQLVLPAMLGYDDSIVEFARYDVEAARRLLADAGVITPVTIELWYPPTTSALYSDPRRVAESFAADLAKIGLNVTLRTTDTRSYRRDAAEGRLPLWLEGGRPARGDPDDLLGTFVRPVGTWLNPAMIALLRAAEREVDPSKRGELYKQVSKIAQAEVPRIPAWYVSSAVAASRRVSGYVPHPSGIESFATVGVTR